MSVFLLLRKPAEADVGSDPASPDVGPFSPHQLQERSLTRSIVTSYGNSVAVSHEEVDLSQDRPIPERHGRIASRATSRPDSAAGANSAAIVHRRDGFSTTSLDSSMRSNLRARTTAVRATFFERPRR